MSPSYLYLLLLFLFLSHTTASPIHFNTSQHNHNDHLAFSSPTRPHFRMSLIMKQPKSQRHKLSSPMFRLFGAAAQQDLLVRRQQLESQQNPTSSHFLGLQEKPEHERDAKKTTSSSTSTTTSSESSSSSSDLSSTSNSTAPSGASKPIPLHGGITLVGEYYAIVALGDTSQWFHVQVDTGSGTTAVPIAGCATCLRGDHQYDLSKSSTGNLILCGGGDTRCTCGTGGSCCDASNQCKFALAYADGSGASGHMFQDKMAFLTSDASLPLTPFFTHTLGGITQDTKDFERSQVDGIMGMYVTGTACRPSCMKTAIQSFVDETGADNVFSLCMTPDGGAMTLGAVDNAFLAHGHSYSWVPYSSNTFYTISIGQAIKVGTNTLTYIASSAIVDSGTTLIVLPTTLFNNFRTLFQQHYCEVPDLCEADTWFVGGGCALLTDKHLDILPDITFRVDNSLDLVLSSRDYMLDYVFEGHSYKCLGLMPMGSSFILGNTLMQKYATVYDRANRKVGFGIRDPKCGA